MIYHTSVVLIKFKTINVLMTVDASCRLLLLFLSGSSQRPTSHTWFKKPLFTKQSAFNVAGNLVIVVKFTFQIVFGNSRQIQDTLAREVTISHSRCILSFDLIDKHQNKRFYVMETVLLLAFSDVIFGGRETMTGNTSAAHRLANR